jgi:hypothetical protein
MDKPVDALAQDLREARCHCGGSSLTCRGAPRKVSLCHCLQCQRRTGSLFSVAAFFPRDAVEQTAGRWASYVRPSVSGQAVRFHFCPDCGSNVWWEPDRMPHLIGVAVGAFGDPSFPMPEQAVWASERHDWLNSLGSLPSHRGNPAPRQPAD